MKKQNTKDLATITIILAVAFLAAGLIFVPAIVQHLQQAQARSPTGACASFFKNASAQICHRI
jgi:hypothetical protein